MQFPKLTPLQSRFAASLLASVLLVIIYLTFSNPHFAYAAELELSGDGTLRGGEGRTWQVAEAPSWQKEEADRELWAEDEPALRPESAREQKRAEAPSRSRARAVTPSLIPDNNIPGNLNINPGEHQIWVFQNTTLWKAYAPAVTGLPSDPEGANDSNLMNKEHLNKRQGFSEESEDDPEQERTLYTRQSSTSRDVYISINTCLQPTWNGTSPQISSPPQLTLYVSLSNSNQEPGPSAKNDEQQVLPLVEGYANFSLPAEGSFYMAVSAPTLPTGFTGGWNYDIAASIDGYYHRLVPSRPFLYLVDSDTSSALLVTGNFTTASADSDVYQEWMNITTVPYILFAQNTDDPRIDGVLNSFCGLQNAPAQIMADIQDPSGVTNQVQMDMTARGLGHKPKEQFFLQGLNGSSSYQGILAMQGNSTRFGPGVVGGGGQVFQPMSFLTKSDGNCALMFNLDFCSEVAYAVPSNPHTYPSLDTLAALYDSNAAALYQNFSYSLQQIPCNTTSTAQYSLAKTCDDCAAAYKEWLCAVTIPRCADYSSNLSYLQPRNMGQVFIENDTMLPEFVLQQQYLPMAGAPGNSVAQKQTYISTLSSNSSRNPSIIDDMIMPGPYKELLPCEDLCYSLVQSCPASLGFGCPFKGRGLEASYGFRSENLTCSYLGAIYYLNDGIRLGGSSLAVGVGIMMSMMMLW